MNNLKVSRKTGLYQNVVKTNLKKVLQISMVFIAGGFLAACTDSTNTLHTINGIQVPPDPGAAGKATLAGIDSNNNGVRDDVERFIAGEYGSNKELYDKAFLQATSVQKLFESLSTSSAQGLSKAYRCSSDEDREIFKKIKDKHSNTEERFEKRAELMINIPILPRRTNCE